MFYVLQEEYISVIIKCIRFMLQNMFIVGSSYWPMAYGQMPGDVEKDEEGLATMKNLGRNMAHLLISLNAADRHKGIF